MVLLEQLQAKSLTFLHPPQSGFVKDGLIRMGVAFISEYADKLAKVVVNTIDLKQIALHSHSLLLGHEHREALCRGVLPTLSRRLLLAVLSFLIAVLLHFL